MFIALSANPAGIAPALGLTGIGSVLVLWTAAFWGIGALRWARRRLQNGMKWPSLSILVAARNEQAYIGQCLRGLLALDYPTDRLQIILVDDHSTDQTRAIAEEFARCSEGKLLIIAAPDGILGVGPKKNALIAGIEVATGEILVFTDADCLTQRGWAKALAGSFDVRTGAVTGPVMPVDRADARSKLAWLERLFISYTTASAIGWDSPASASGGNFAYRRIVFDALGGFAHSRLASGDDDLMAQAIARHGWAVRFARGADAVVKDLRLPVFRQQVQSAIRHQSTTRYYPLGWRAVYALSVLSYLVFLLLIAATIYYPSGRGLLIAVLAARLAIDAVGVYSFCEQTKIPLSIGRFLLAETCMPLYILVRAMLSIPPKYSWQDRTHRTTTTTPPPPSL
jgi:cellulose synthase/poly-beta-1,6-N-acetylglucosamine synthase-like glycosyltransferase